jgi:hypothetical protein
VDNEHCHKLRELQSSQPSQQAIRTPKRFLKETANLNSAFFLDDQGYISHNVQDYSVTESNGKTGVIFKDLEKHLIRFIREAEVILGCVAWVTSEPILEALSAKKGVSIIVQKEDFLRPDFMPSDGWSRKLRLLYDGLPKRLDWRDFPGPLGSLTIETYPIIDPIRCVGNHNVDKQPAYPRSHHKFVLFCKAVEKCTCKWCREEKGYILETIGLSECNCDYCSGYEKNRLHIQPYAVWTGSFNFTRNAVMSFENALILYDAKIINAFYQEYSQIAALSEPLNWTTGWSNPQWRIQTWT